MSQLVSLALAHLRISLLALALGMVLAVPLGIAALRRPRLERVVLGFASVVQTIPGLALLAVMVPALAALGAATEVRVPSIGELPAVLALSVYALLPIVRGLVLGIGGIDPAIREAADAVGMTEAQRLRRVEIPLALPHLVGGLRTATVWTVGMATLATPVGARSLGELIFGGLQTRRYDDVLLGCFASAALAIALDLLLRASERSAQKRARRFVDPALGALGLLVVWAVGATAWGALRHDDRLVRIGAKSFTEQYVLAAMLSQELEATGVNTQTSPSLGTTVAFDALVAGELDLYVEYTGTVWTTLMKRTDVPDDRTVVRRDVEAWLEREHGVVVAATLGFENAYALVVRDAATARRISDLGRAEGLSLATDYEFLSRPEWTALKDVYGLAFRERRPMDPSLLYDALASGDVDVVTGYTSDARIEALGLRVLTDDRAVIPPYDALVLVRKSFEREQPSAYRAITSLEGAVDVATMRSLNLAVDRDKRRPQDVAADFLRGRAR